MGVLRAGFNGTVGQSSAQVIDGSLKFDSTKNQYLKRDPGSVGNQKTYTYSTWVKRYPGTYTRLFGNYYTGNYIGIALDFRNDDKIEFHNYDGSSYVDQKVSNDVFRDNGWYHCVWVIDTTQSASEDKFKIYVNNRRITSWTTNTVGTSTDGNTYGNDTNEHRIGYNYVYGNQTLTNTYFIDGQALTPSEFGFTDPLTNTWRPKKYTGTFTGTNTFYLPFDGNSPIGQDKSGNGNHWTPVNFGGSVALDNPNVSGARPILNTTQGGTQAAPGVFGSKENKYYTVTTANGSVYQFDITSGDNPSLSFIRGATYKFDYSSFTGHPVLFSSTNPDSSTTAYTDGTSTASNVISFTVPHDAPDTLYYYCQNHPTSMNGSISITTDETKADPYAWKNVLGLPLVGSKDDVSNQINSGSTTKTVTANGNAAASNAQSNFYGGSYYFDGTGDYLTVAVGTDTQFGTGDFTVEWYLYYTGATSGFGGHIVDFRGSNNGAHVYYVNNGRIYWINDNVAGDIDTGASVNANQWTHWAFARNSGTYRLFKDGVLVYSVANSDNIPANSTLYIANRFTDSGQLPGYLQDLRIYKGVAKYTSNFIPASTNPDILPDTPSGVSGGSKLTKITDGAVHFDGSGDYLRIAATSDFDQSPGTDFTAEAYIYMTAASGPSHIMGFQVDGNNRCSFYFTDGTTTLNWYTNLSGSGSNKISTSSNYVSLNAWHHVAVTRSGSTSYLFVDGILQGTSTTTDYPSGNQLLDIGTYNASGYNPDSFPGFISNVRYIKGTALYTSNFTPPTEPLTNVTNTKLLCCQSNTSATAAAVTPGSITANGDAAATNFNPFNTDINTVRGQETGYCTVNPLANGGLTLSNGNLDVTGSGNTQKSAYTTFAVDSGKWYFEFLVKQTTSGNIAAGVANVGNFSLSTQLGATSTSWAVIAGGSTTVYKYHNSSVSSIGSYSAGTIINIAFDVEGGNIWFGINGNYVDGGNPYTGDSPVYSNLTGTLYPMVNGYGTSDNMSLNFGQKPFKFPPPAGFQPLNSANVRPETVITRPDQYVGVTTYIGNGVSGRKVSGYNFKPDFVWVKMRQAVSGGIEQHMLMDTVRGARNYLVSNSTAVEGTNEGIITFERDGFTVDSGWYVNRDTGPYVAWAWKAGGNKNTFNIDDVGYASAAAAGLDGGTITPTGASVGTRSGFSIITYTGNGTSGATISHGLQKTPQFFVVKSRNTTATGWLVYHKALTATSFLQLDSTAAVGSNATAWNNTEPTSSLITFGNSAFSNGDAHTYVCYAWADVPGLQKFGSYTGNGLADGPVVITGFRPRWLLVKKSSATGNQRGWVLVDSERSKYNVSNLTLFPHAAAAEDTGTYIAVDFLSNGFKLRSTEEAANQSYTYIYAAFAEAPAFNLYGGQSNAR